MKVLLIMTGGAIDSAISTAMRPVRKFRAVRSQAFHTLLMLNETTARMDELDHLAIGKHGAKFIDDGTYPHLIGAIRQEQAKTQRIIVTMNSRQLREIGARLSHQFMGGIGCPVVLTGAEAPFPSPAESAASNLSTALNAAPFASPGIYYAEGRIFETLSPHLTEYTPSHPVRSTGTAWKPRQRRLAPLSY